IRFMPYEEAYPGGGFEDIRCRQPDTSKIRSLTRWRPRRTLDDILRDVVAERVPALAPAPVALEPSIEMAV
ncbi:MAG: NAD-dependent epimerase/dehydratase family protein, partial [Actinomycetia bacterium]|nr:NAD-dependent epimerase/dehydratase family protein [Actinomycetes bacterium]